jgi:septum formation protein
MTTFILASASPARRAVLTAAGVDPEVRVANLNEDKLIAGMAGSEPEKIVTELAVAKVKAVIRTLEPPLTGDAVVVACDSMLRLGKSLLGKPVTVERARLYWDQMAGRTGTLLTGHAVVRLVDGTAVATADGCEATQIRFGRPTDPELEAYLATGEPLQVAGACTIDGLGGWFIDGVEGDPSSVIGISLPLTRRLLERVGLRVTDLWRAADPV